MTDKHDQLTADALLYHAEPVPGKTATALTKPCARPNWHTHPLGQTSILTAGVPR